MEQQKNMAPAATTTTKMVRVPVLEIEMPEHCVVYTLACFAIIVFIVLIRSMTSGGSSAAASKKKNDDEGARPSAAAGVNTTAARPSANNRPRSTREN